MQLQSAIISNKAIARVIVDITWDFTREIITMIYLIYTHATEYFTDLLPQSVAGAILFIYSSILVQQYKSHTNLFRMIEEAACIPSFS